jgi:hypothetical protein
LENILKNQAVDNGAFSDICYHRLESPNWIRLFYLFHRLFEAHFLPIHMMILVIASGLYCFLTKDKPDNLQIVWIFIICNYLRVTGFLMVAVYLALYENFHSICVAARKAEMMAAGLYDGMQESFSYRTMWKNKLDYIMIPVAAPIFGSVPAIQAQLSHFWTLDLVYTVSMKPSNKCDSSVEYPA